MFSRKLLKYWFFSLLKENLSLANSIQHLSAWKYKPTGVAEMNSKPSISSHNQGCSPKPAPANQPLPGDPQATGWPMPFCQERKVGFLPGVKQAKPCATEGHWWVMYFSWLASFRIYQVLIIGGSPLKIMLLVYIHSRHRDCFLFGNTLPREVYMKLLLWKTAPEKVVGRSQNFLCFLFLGPKCLTSASNGYSATEHTVFNVHLAHLILKAMRIE